MAIVVPSDLIAGVVTVRLDVHADPRGAFRETYRHDWVPETPLMVQANRSDSAKGVLRGLHYHRHQADYWYSPTGGLFVCLFDLRPDAPTFRTTQTLELDDATGLYIPPGVAHGFQATADCTLTYLVDRYYDPEDELGLACDDPEVAAGWPLADPILSDRDKANPPLSSIVPSR